MWEVDGRGSCEDVMLGTKLLDFFGFAGIFFTYVYR